MEDRIPTPGQDGRVLITPENGSAPFYATIAMADNPTNPGTPLNKQTFLQDSTEILLFGDAGNRTVDDVFQKLSEAAMFPSNTGILETILGVPIPVGVELVTYTGTGASTKKVTFDTDTDVFLVAGNLAFIMGQVGKNWAILTCKDTTYSESFVDEVAVAWSGSTVTFSNSIDPRYCVNTNNKPYWAIGIKCI